MSFNIDETGKLELKIYDEQAKTIYNDDVKNFNGEYSFDIKDAIDFEKSGKYFISVKIGNKSGISKLVIKKI